MGRTSKFNENIKIILKCPNLAFVCLLIFKQFKASHELVTEIQDKKYMLF